MTVLSGESMYSLLVARFGLCWMRYFSGFGGLVKTEKTFGKIDKTDTTH